MNEVDRNPYQLNHPTPPSGEPECHWKYDLNGQTFVREPGRRPAGYFIAGQGSNQYNNIGQFIELPLVNKIRPRVKPGGRRAIPASPA